MLSKNFFNFPKMSQSMSVSKNNLTKDGSPCLYHSFICKKENVQILTFPNELNKMLSHLGASFVSLGKMVLS